MKQISLFKPEDLPPRILYEKLFENLPYPNWDEKGRGRPPTSRNFILKTLIYKVLRRIHSLTDIVFELKNNPSVLAVLAEAVNLLDCAWIDNKENLLFFGPPGIGNYVKFLLM